MEIVSVEKKIVDKLVGECTENVKEERITEKKKNLK